MEFEQRDWLQVQSFKELLRPLRGSHPLQRFFARHKSSFLGRKTSESNYQTSSDQLPQEVKSAQYKSVEYEIGLEKKGSYMCKFKHRCKQEYFERLLCSEQTVPQDSLFHDDLFEKTCEKIRNRNELTVIRDISSLVLPSAQTWRHTPRSSF